MIFPIGDDNTDRTMTPTVNYALIALNVLVFVLLQGFGSNQEFTLAFSTVPAEIVTGHDVVTGGRILSDPQTGGPVVIPGLQPTPFSVYLTLLTSMFMHGGIGHIFGNLLYLGIFGDNIENAIGHRRYLLFYLLCGILASLAHVFSSVLLKDNLAVPSLGASGAISGVLGAYILLFPKRRVRVIMIRFIQEVPAIVAIGIWFLFQLVSGIGMLGGSQGGVAYAAHIGGFISGIILIKLFMPHSSSIIRSA